MRAWKMCIAGAVSFASVIKFPEAVASTIPSGADIGSVAVCTAAKNQR